MKHGKSDKHRRAKAIGTAAAALIAGVGLLILSRSVIASGKRAAAEAAAQSQPATQTAPATPGSPADPSGRLPPQGANQKAAAAQRMGGLLLLFSLMCFGVAATSAGWIYYDIRRSRPAWMRQNKYPIRERHR